MIWSDFCKRHDIPLCYRDCSIDLLEIGESFKKRSEDWIASPHSMILYGDPGRGKSYFLFCLIRGLFCLGYLPSQVRYINACDLDAKIEENLMLYRSSSTYIDSLADNDFLFIDDFGVESSKEVSERNYYRLLDKRLANNMPTILSTNLSDQEILTNFGSRIESRLRQCEKLLFDGPDLRKPKRNS